MPREVRVARNATLMREVNERIRELGLWDAGEPMGFVCECSSAGCSAPVYATLSQYSSVRSISGYFLVALGHVDEATERVVRTSENFAIVERLFDDEDEPAPGLRQTG